MEIQLPIVQNGALGDCPHQDCRFVCCEFNEGNFIAMYPGELEQARLAGKSVGHLLARPDGMGGQRAICTAKDKSTCDLGYKPLDCASYPLFPTLSANGRVQANLKGSKCPLESNSLHAHRSWVASSWNRLRATVPGLLGWIQGVSLIGYERTNEFDEESRTT